MHLVFVQLAEPDRNLDERIEITAPGFASSTVYFLPACSTPLPADRAEAKSRSADMGKFRACKSRSNS